MALPGQRRLTDRFHRVLLHRLAAVWLMLLLGGAAVVLPKEKHAEEVKALIERARAVCNLEAEGAAPHVLEAMVFVHVADAVVQGHYLLVWQSPHRWRDELTFPRYVQARVGTESAMWRRRNTNHQPLPVVQFLEGLSLALPPEQVPPGWKLTLRKGPESVNVAKCVNLQRSSPMLAQTVAAEWCFEPGSGVLTRRSSSDWDTSWEYLDYTPWNGRQYPRRINILQGAKPVVEARIKVMDAPNLDPAQFAVLENAEEWPRCENVRPGKLVSSDPTILAPPRGGKQTLTPVWIEVGADGRVQDVVVLRPMADVEREHYLFISLKQRWKFQPASCGKTPIPFRMLLNFPF